MNHYVLSPRAQHDLASIWDYTAQRWGEDQAERYVRQLQASIEQIASDPGLGAPCDDIRAGYRKHPSGSHLLFYRRIDSGIDIVRILHARMDLPQHL
jgi:toxin ParE1/3/4